MIKSVSFILLIVILSNSYLFANNNNDLLSRIITINVKNKRLDTTLQLIGKESGFSFSYNSSILDLTKNVSIKKQNVTVNNLLNELLGSHYEFKQIGNSHVIIREALTLTIKPIEQKKRLSKTEVNHLKSDAEIQGRVIDQKTGKGIEYVVVYDESEKVLSLTDSLGYYSLKTSVERLQKGVFFRGLGYYDTMVQLSPKNDNATTRFDVVLTPNNNNTLPVTTDLAIQQEKVHQLKFIQNFIPEEANIISNNIEYTATRGFQFTLIPFISNNNFLGGSYTNKFSINVFLGYSAGVNNGLEVGGFVNINRNNMKGVQIAGISNIVGKDVHGVQTGGIINYDMGSVDGLQVGGIINVVEDSLVGVQIGGINNNVRENVRGLQIGGIINTTRTDIKGVQIGGIYNYSKKVYGAQIGGILNTTQKTVNGLQLAGISSYTKDLKGWQVSGITNTVSATNKGVQLSGIYNYSKTQKGVQIGLINTAKEVDGGIAIGLFTYYKNGYHAVAYSINEYGFLNGTFYSGTKQLYNYYRIGAQLKENYNFGVGFGSFLFKRLVLEVGLENIFDLKQEDISSQFIKLNMLYVQPILKKLSITIGPSFNVNYSATPNEFTPPPSFYHQKLNDNSTYWISGSIGIRYNW
ncbi:STN domain-containing protein [Flammeovirga kamogawensis]|uniref:STN domain-containing protein n=1 Tax=Flammeovirga kamogawensis TaxID=373891 RepID=A0ABX8GYU8_9BACT|nr:STN domain-containing protein [Flammeovirga kamogawensis]MBB6459220.1 hypothetical protein [Flammeovirga kamogawensis]QWG08785.1 STN domain-containing protein [Flammeovirga kamogawensis]TRX67075.1 hypothetical protein EO216_02585 [Flammeovirga kamogawensis]